MKTIRLDDPELAGTYEVEQLDGGDLLLHRTVTSAAEILGGQRARALSPDEFQAHFGQLPRDGEG